MSTPGSRQNSGVFHKSHTLAQSERRESILGRHGTYLASQLTQALLSRDERAQECQHEDEASSENSEEVVQKEVSQKIGSSDECADHGVDKQRKSGRLRFKSCALKMRNSLRMAKSVKRLRSFSDDVLSLDKLGPDFRLVDRRAAFGQSRGHWFLHNIFSKRWRAPSLDGLDSDSGRDTLKEVGALLLEDLYHTFLDAKFSVQLFFFFLAYLMSFFMFAVFYLIISKPCGLNIDGSLLKAYLLSLETMTTIGYGVPDPYMKGCWQAPIVLTGQVLLNLLISSCLIGVIFQGISRPQSRACTILFSESAIIRCIDGAYYFMFRVCDLRLGHALIEPHVRCYCVEQNDVRGFEATQMRLVQPDDELGASLLLSMPSVVVHRIDAWSPLAPPRPAADAGPKSPPANVLRSPSDSKFKRSASFDVDKADSKFKRSASFDVDKALSARATAPRQRGSGLEENLRLRRWPWPKQRMAEAECGGRDTCACPTCGETFPTVDTLKLHCRYNAANDKASGLPEEVCHRELSEKDVAQLCHRDPSLEELSTYLKKHFKEVVVLVEGIEPTTSSTLQARQSYIVGHPECATSDTCWNMDFVDCVMMPEDDKSEGLGVDLGRFHEMQPVEETV
eukprot:TRINITY_DN26302_c0_g1_i1.p1 TRINITY_DN26302_c0_g1~~TRINITY_DN26302_c0_g1_i1.p1  ORF type:complete len:621 (-),score=81.84 TRINITY_DN26302_c0_g1_i1:72-1934(-)